MGLGVQRNHPRIYNKTKFFYRLKQFNAKVIDNPNQLGKVLEDYPSLNHGHNMK